MTRSTTSEHLHSIPLADVSGIAGGQSGCGRATTCTESTETTATLRMTKVYARAARGDSGGMFPVELRAPRTDELTRSVFGLFSRCMATGWQNRPRSECGSFPVLFLLWFWVILGRMTPMPWLAGVDVPARLGVSAEFFRSSGRACSRGFGFRFPAVV